VKRHDDDGFRPILLAVIGDVWNASVDNITATTTSSKTIVRRLGVVRFIGKRYGGVSAAS